MPKLNIESICFNSVVIFCLSRSKELVGFQIQMIILYCNLR